MCQPGERTRISDVLLLSKTDHSENIKNSKISKNSVKSVISGKKSSNPSTAGGAFTFPAGFEA